MLIYHWSLLIWSCIIHGVYLNSNYSLVKSTVIKLWCMYIILINFKGKFVTGFEKTDHVNTRIEIHFIACYNSHTQALSRHSDTIAINKKVCFYRQLLLTLSSHAGPSQILWGYWGALIRWHVVPNCSTQRLLSTWYGKVCYSHLSGPLCTQLGRLCLKA